MKWNPKPLLIKNFRIATNPEPTFIYEKHTKIFISYAVFWGKPRDSRTNRDHSL